MIQFDKRLYRHDIRGSIAHATMLGEVGIVPEAEAKEKGVFDVPAATSIVDPTGAVATASPEAATPAGGVPAASAPAEAVASQESAAETPSTETGPAA